MPTTTPVRRAPARPTKPKPSPALDAHPSGKSWLEVALSLGAKHLLHEPENGKGRCSEVIEWKPPVAIRDRAKSIAHRWFYPHSQLKRDSLAFRERRAKSVVEHIETQTPPSSRA